MERAPAMLCESSSANSGFPSVRSASDCKVSGGTRVPSKLPIISRMFSRSRRESAIIEWNGRVGHGGMKRGRAVNNNITDACSTCSPNMTNSSSVDGSEKCRSSTTSTVGCEREEPITQSTRDCNKCMRCCSGESRTGGYFPGGTATPSRDATNGTDFVVSIPTSEKELSRSATFFSTGVSFVHAKAFSIRSIVGAKGVSCSYGDDSPSIHV